MTISPLRAACALSLAFALPLPNAIFVAQAQIATVNLGGTLRNEAGAPVANADVVVVLQNAGIRRTLTLQSDAQGRFSVPIGSTPLTAFIHAPGYALTMAELSGADNQIALIKGAAATGKVVDEKGAPVAGARVRLNYMEYRAPDDAVDRQRVIEPDYAVPFSPISRAFETQTDANGAWTLADLWPGGVAQVALYDPRFLERNVDAPLQQTPASLTQLPDLKAQPGARLSGRVVFPDGKPVAGADVSARIAQVGDIYPQTITKADGSYQLWGLPAGTATVYVAPPARQWAPSGVRGVALNLNQEARAPDIQLGGGVSVAGTVRDRSNKAPIAGVTVYAAGPFGNSNNGLTDAQGRYQLRVAAGENRFAVIGVPPDYLNQMMRNVGARTVKADSTAAPDFTIERGVTLRGTAFDQNGQPAVGAALATGNIMDGAETTVDEKGDWILRGVNPDARRPGDTPDTPRRKIPINASGDWQIVGEAAADARSETPLALQLRRIERQDVTVRVVTPSGTPIEGAAVEFSVRLNSAQGSRRFEKALTDARGEATLRAIRPDESARFTPSKAGYALGSEGKIVGIEAAQNGVRVTDAVLTPRDAALRGRIVDERGAPVAGARFAVLAGRAQQTIGQSDGNGRFALEELSAGDIIVGAARARQWGQITTVTGADVTLQLTPAAPQPAPADRDRARDLLVQWLSEAGTDIDYDWIQLAAAFAVFDPPSAPLLRAQIKQDSRRWFDEAVAEKQGATDPARLLVAARAEVARPQAIAAHNKALLDLAELLVQSGDLTEAGEVYQSLAPDALSGSKTVAPDSANFAGYRFARLAGVTSALRHRDADFWVEMLDRAVAQLPEDERISRSGGYAASFARNDSAGALAWLETLEPAAQVRALEDVIPLLAQRDLPAAQLQLARMEALASRPDLPVAEARDDAMYRPTPARSLNVARSAVVRALLPLDARAAHDEAEKLTEDGYGPSTTRSLVVETALALPPAEALPILRAAWEGSQGAEWGAAGRMARLAMLVAPYDATLSESWFNKAYQRLTENSFRDTKVGEPAAQYAFYRASSDPAQSRLLLENEWSRALSEDRLYLLDRLIWAMAPVNFGRALQMIEFANAKGMRSGTEAVETRRNLLTWLIADEAARVTMNFDAPQSALTTNF